LRLICAKQQNAVRDGTSSKELSVGRFPLAHTSPDPPDREKVEANRQTPRANIPNQTDFGPAWEPGSSVLWSLNSFFFLHLPGARHAAIAHCQQATFDCPRMTRFRSMRTMSRLFAKA